MPLDIQKSIQIIKDFKPLEIPTFTDGNQDTFDYMVCNLYHRVCQAIKSFVVLFENERFYDSFIIAGHCLETCAILSYIKDNPAYELCREKYNKYFASATLGRLKYNLDLSYNLEKEIAWQAFVSLLKLFYPVGKYIVKEKEKEQYEEIIKKINCRLGLNKEKIEILSKHFLPTRVNEYIKTFVKNTAYFDGEQFSKFYKKYCDVKHGNMITPGSSFEHNSFEYFSEDGIMLILGIMYYLKDFKL